jgi:hypothetical protein
MRSCESYQAMKKLYLFETTTNVSQIATEAESEEAAREKIMEHLKALEIKVGSVTLKNAIDVKTILQKEKLT